MFSCIYLPFSLLGGELFEVTLSHFQGPVAELGQLSCSASAFLRK